MVEILKSIFMGIVQGLTEFLPVSSSGHLTFLQLLGFGAPSLFFNVCLHFGTLAAVIVVYRRRIWEIFKNPRENKWWLYVVATIPTGLIAVAYKLWLPEALLGAYLPFGFMASAVLLLLADLVKPNQIRPLSYKAATLTGVMQGIAVLPALSRSGSTLSVLLLSGVDKERAAEFSFLLSIPIIILSGAAEAVTLKPSDLAYGAAEIIAGVAAAFISGLLAIRFMLKLIKNRRFWGFSVYLAVLSVLSFVLLY